MGTKNNPGAFDCYANAEPDEPMFVLLGRDRHAAALVNLWAVMREVEGEDTFKVAEARACADLMVDYRHDSLLGWRDNKEPAGIATLAQALVKFVNRCGARISIEPVVAPDGVTWTYRVDIWPVRDNAT